MGRFQPVAGELRVCRIAGERLIPKSRRISVRRHGVIDMLARVGEKCSRCRIGKELVFSQSRCLQRMFEGTLRLVSMMF